LAISLLLAGLGLARSRFGPALGAAAYPTEFAPAWVSTALAAALCRTVWERGLSERRKEYQALAEEHLEAHERFEAATTRLREKNEALERKYAETSALCDAVGAIGASTQPAEICEMIVDTALKLVPCDSCVLAVAGEPDEAWPVVAVRGGFSAWRKGDRVRWNEGILGWVAKQGQPTLVPEVGKDARFVATKAEAWFRSLLVVPLMIEGRVAAVVGLGRADEPDLQTDDLWRMTRLASQAAIALDRAYLHQELARLATTDGLTGLYNRRYFEQALHREVQRAKRYGTKLSLLLFDVDHFKHFNDHNGHPMGDKLLREVAAVIRGAVRQVDVAARYGGEEFVVILPETDLAAALNVAERIRRGVGALQVEGAATQPLGRLSLAGGAAAFPAPARTAEELVQLADAALYEAKHGGRDRCQACKDFLAG
ncbi:MAG: diguanylate cyclase, partial [Chitinophagales bacterium]